MRSVCAVRKGPASSSRVSSNDDVLRFASLGFARRTWYGWSVDGTFMLMDDELLLLPDELLLLLPDELRGLNFLLARRAIANDDEVLSPHFTMIASISRSTMATIVSTRMSPPNMVNFFASFGFFFFRYDVWFLD